jgi:hypothetical protein
MPAKPTRAPISDSRTASWAMNERNVTSGQTWTRRCRFRPLGRLRIIRSADVG